MKRRPIIGISCYGRGRTPDEDRYSVPVEYVEAVHRAGAHAVLLPPGDPSVLEGVDGLVLAGGGDIDPSRYGADLRHPTVYGLDAERDQFELGLAREALARKLPMIAICRGMQVVNVALGGDLHQHIGDLPEVGMHRGDGCPVTHVVRAEPESLLARVTGGRELHVCSEHHQAVKRLGDGLKIVAHAEDGTVEALESAHHPDLIAVQWHPEDSAKDDPAQQRLFDWLATQATL